MECVVSGEGSGHRLYGPWELIEPYLSVMFHNNITASFRFDTMELSWTVSGSSIYWNINAPEIIGLKLDHHHHYHRLDTLILTCDESMLLRPVIVRRGRGVRRGQNCENIEQDTRKRVNMHCFTGLLSRQRMSFLVWPSQGLMTAHQANRLSSGWETCQECGGRMGFHNIYRRYNLSPPKIK